MGVWGWPRVSRAFMPWVPQALLLPSMIPWAGCSWGTGLGSIPLLCPAPRGAAAPLTHLSLSHLIPLEFQAETPVGQPCLLLEPRTGPITCLGQIWGTQRPPWYQIWTMAQGN